jgi:hypothetical protein
MRRIAFTGSGVNPRLPRHFAEPQKNLLAVFTFATIESETFAILLNLNILNDRHDGCFCT